MFIIEQSTHPFFKEGAPHSVNLVDFGNPCDGSFSDLFSEKLSKECTPGTEGQPVECGNVMIDFSE